MNRFRKKLQRKIEKLRETTTTVSIMAIEEEEVKTSNGTTIVPHGERWAAAFGIGDASTRARLRARYELLKEKLVFKMDAHDIADPLSAFAAIDAPSEEPDGRNDQAQENDATNGKRANWSQFISEENLLQEINTDLERLYPAGNEGFFQNIKYLNVLRQVLFVWCKLHPDVSYRQGMHDVAAMVFYAFLLVRKLKPAAADSASHTEPQQEKHADLFATPATVSLKFTALEQKTQEEDEDEDDEPPLPDHIEADTFLVFEAILLYLKPFYEIVKTPYQDDRRSSSRKASSEDEARLFSSSENDDPNHLFGGPAVAVVAQASTPTAQKLKRPALHQLCYHVQYELLEQKDPQLFYHLQNLDIVPETYCLRWIRLLFAREYTFEALLYVWDGLIHDESRPPVVYPDVTDPSQWLDRLPTLETTRSVDDGDEEDASWMGFPLLRYLCVAKLLKISPELRRADNTGCLRLLMQSFSIEAIESNATHEQSARELVTFAQVLQNPMLEQQDGPQGLDVVEFGPGSLGIVLTAAKNPFETRLAVKDFAPDVAMAATAGMGQAQASGRVQVGDLLESINGVPIIGLTTEEVKRHIQLVARPLFIGFRHCSRVDEPTSGCQVPLSLLSPRANASSTSLSSGATASASELLQAEVLLPMFLPGELCYANVETSMQKFSLLQDGACLAHYISGRFYITNYRCIFARLLSPSDVDWQVPVLSIASVEGSDTGGPLLLGASAMDHAQAVLGFSPLSDETQNYSVVVRCKDAQNARLSFTNYSDYSKLYKCLTCLAFPATLLDAFCFAYTPTIAPSEEVPFDLRREYRRIGLLDFPDRFRCIDQSSRYELCETYPQHLIVPAEMSDVKVKSAAAFRSHNRLPVVSWVHRTNGATISRASQPLVGLKSNRSFEDELLVRLLCCSGNLHSFGRYVIMDARSQLAAVGNKAMGKGTEIAANYRGAKLGFMNIDNIHSIRQSLQSLTAVFEPRKGASESDSSTSFYGKIENSGWLRHVRLILKASVELAQSVHSGISVLTHCSDGWDRTSQMVALAELMLDPFYRTLRGFQVLIEKEWCAFGHQFAARCGHARSDASNDQRSPVFLLWLDCVWQFVRQFPSECEFGESLLLALADHTFSCKYGTFMFDCERQRKEFFAKHRVYSMWSDINSHSETFTSPVYAPTRDAALLAPSTLSKNIKLWKGYFCRWDPTFIPPVAARQFY